MNNILAYVISFVLMIVACIGMNAVLGLLGVPSLVLTILSFALGWFWPLQKIAEFIKSV